MSSGVKDGIRKRADYRYNGLGQRVGQRVYENENINPEKEIYYTLDLTRQYHNLLNLKDNITDKEQIYYWDMNVVSMEENEAYCYYLQDDLGSPMQLVDEEGLIIETYGFDEFGMELPTDDNLAVNANRTNKSTDIGFHNNKLQPFSFASYQMDEAGEMYFAQARRYDAGIGRFVSEDNIVGWTDAPVTLNRYSYCWNSPLMFVDLDGLSPREVIEELKDLFVGVKCIISYMKVGQTLVWGKGILNLPECPEVPTIVVEDVNISGDYVPIYDCSYYNSQEYIFNTNCYSYAFGMLVNPLTGEKFPYRGNQPGLLSNNMYYLNAHYFNIENAKDEYRIHFFSGTEESNNNLVNVVKDDMDVVGLNFTEYKEGMTGGKRVALVVGKERDYHWYVYDDNTGTWWNKNGLYWATNNMLDENAIYPHIYMEEITDYREAAQCAGYDVIVGEFYITKKNGECFE